MRTLERLQPLSLLLLRLGIGVIFLGTGYEKLFREPAKWLVSFSHWGFPSYFAYIAGAFEFFGAILLILGLLTRGVGLILAIQMAIAEIKVTIPHASFYTATTYAVPLLLCLGCFVLATFGSGTPSLDSVFKGRSSLNKRK